MTPAQRKGTELVGQLRRAKKEKDVDTLAAIARDGDVKPAMRLQALKGLTKAGDVRAVKSLTGLVEDQNPTCRFAAIDAIAALGGTEGIGVLIKAVDAPGSKTAIKATEALGVLKAKAAVPVLVSQLASLDWKVRRSAALALSRIGDKKGLAAVAAQGEKEVGRAKQRVMSRYAVPSDKR